jgi:hypothetical protein
MDSRAVGLQFGDPFRHDDLVHRIQPGITQRGVKVQRILPA